MLDLSARNRLLNVPRSSKSAKTIEIVDEMAGEVLRLLVREGKAFTFLPGKETRGDQTSSNDEDEETLVDLPQPDDDEIDEREVAAHHVDTKLQTRMTLKGLQKRLFDLHPKAKNAPVVATSPTDRATAGSNTGGSAGPQDSVLTDVDR